MKTGARKQNSKAKDVPKRKSEREVANRTAEFYLACSLAVIAVLGIIVISQRLAECQEKMVVTGKQQGKIEDLKSEIESLEKKTEEIQHSDIAWERLVREKLDYTRPGEHVLKFEKKEGSD